MNVRKEKCEWCEKTYAVKDSTASYRDCYCSEECENESRKAADDYEKWCREVSDAWYAYCQEYEPGEDEANPRFLDGSPCDPPSLYNRGQYLAFKTRYQKWKNNHCWKKSFWEWDGSSGGSFFGGGGGGGGDGGGCVKAVIKLIGFAVVAWLGWIVIKSGWNWMFGGGGNEVITEAAIMKKWEEHLEKRREAFDDGKPEKEIEAKGLRNYTWEEWQAKFKKEHEAAEKPKEDKKEVKGDAGDTVATKAKEIGNQALSAAKGLGDKAKSLWQGITSSKEEKGAEAEAEAVEANAKVEAEAKAKAKAEAESVAKAAAAAKAKAEAEARMKMEAEAHAKAEAEARVMAAAAAEAKSKSEAEARARIEAEARAKAEAEVRAKVEAEAKAKAEAEARARAVAEAAAVDSVGEQQNGTVRKKASADSKGIAITVQGKGKTKDAALRNAIRQAVWKTVGTWVGSRTRMDEKREEVKSRVMTVTQDDVRKFEVLDTQQEGDTIVFKVKVHVSKKKIAPKFEKVFPDVFGND